MPLFPVPGPLLVMALAPTAHAETLEVCGTCAFGTISEAVTAASSGDTIAIAGGSYEGVDVEIAKDVALVGAGSGQTVLTGGWIGVDRTYSVDISGLTVDGGGIGASGATLTLDDVVIKNGWGLLAFKGAEVTVRGSTFENNVLDRDSTSDGAAIDIYESKVDVADSTFTSNRVEGSYGGAISCHGESPLTVSGSTFVGNYAKNGGGAIYAFCPLVVRHTTFTSNESEVEGGGAVFVKAFDTILDDVTMTGNGPIAVYVDYSYQGSLHVTRSAFHANEDGAIVAGSSGPVVVEDSRFTSNGVASGRAVFVECVPFISMSCGAAEIRGNTFEENDGAIYVHGQSSADIYGNTFTRNTGPNGAAVYVDEFDGMPEVDERGWVDIRNNVFCANEVPGDGGALWIGNYQVVVENNVFAENVAEVGGAISDGTTYMGHNTFLGNRASDEGGAMYFTWGYSVENDIVAFTSSGYGASGTYEGSSVWSNWYANTSDHLGDPSEPLDLTNTTSDPRIARWSADRDCSNDDFRLATGSPAIDAGDPYDLDPDGTRSDIGAYGGPGADADGDGFAGPDDCDETNPAAHVGAPERCEAADLDCDGSPGDADADGDGWSECQDCDDSEPAVHPMAEELCDDLDNDCDGTTDEEGADGSAWYADADGDEIGTPDRSKTACDAPAGYVSAGDDCDDGDPTVFPDAPDEIGDGRDTNCDGADGSAVVQPTCRCAPGPGSGAPVSALAGLLLVRARRRPPAARFQSDVA